MSQIEEIDGRRPSSHGGVVVMNSFSWVPFYKELAAKLLTYRERQGELIALLKELKDQGVPVIKLTDKAAKNRSVPLAAIDPFTFFSAFNRKAKEKNRQAILKLIKDRLQVHEAVPSDFDGIPIMHPMMSRFLPWQYEQKADDVASLWALAEAILAGPPESVTPALFDRCLKIKCTKIPNLTMGLFWMRPDTYLALDKRNRALLDRRGVEHKVTDWASYIEFMEKARALVPERPFEFSLAAYVGEPKTPTEVEMSKRDYWILALGERSVLWDECHRGGLVRVGWDKMNSDLGALSREEIRRLNKQKKEGDFKGINDFVKTIKPGDRIFIKKGVGEIIALAEVNGDYRFESSLSGYRHVRPVKWLTTGKWTLPNDAKQLPRKTLTPVGNQERVRELLELIRWREWDGARLALSAQNSIFYGPPGTGKTYTSLKWAVEHATGNPSGDDASIRQQLDDLRGKGRIEFVTFHQSYSYEDFVEGIRPTLDGEGAAIRYECNDGIFKKLALRALYDCLEPREAATTGEFDARWQSLVAQIGAEPEREYDSISGNSKYRLALSSRGNVNATNTKDPDMSQLMFSRVNLMKVFAAHGKKASISTTDIQGTLGVGSHSSLGAVLFRELQKLQPAPGKAKQPALASDDERCDAALAFLNDREVSQYRFRSSGPVAQYVLVIDEINRGNISKIFGELITLIEADKRIGAQNEMRVLLPYSKKLFGVPRNLHLIGTMNTADKSIALVDVALRRRFEFEELMPRYDLVSEAVRGVLKEMNRRITLRKDRDHQIGHACFMANANVNAVLIGKVLPLLQEYFYNDWDGLRYVLGEKDDKGDFIVRIPVKPNEPKPRHAWQWCFDAGVKRDDFDAMAFLKNHYE